MMVRRARKSGQVQIIVVTSRQINVKQFWCKTWSRNTQRLSQLLLTKIRLDPVKFMGNKPQIIWEKMPF